MLIKIADHFGVSTDYLLGRDDNLYLNISGLKTQEVAHIQQLISDLKSR